MLKLKYINPSFMFVYEYCTVYTTITHVVLVISILVLIIRYKSWQQFWGHWNEEEWDRWSAATATGCKESCIQLVVPNFGYNWALACTHCYVYKCVFLHPYTYLHRLRLIIWNFAIMGYWCCSHCKYKLHHLQPTITFTIPST